MHLLSTCMSSLEKFLFRSSAHFLIRLLAIKLYKFFIYLVLTPYRIMCFVNILLVVPFAEQKHFGLMSSCYFIFTFLAFASGVRLVKSLPRLVSGAYHLLRVLLLQVLHSSF